MKRLRIIHKLRTALALLGFVAVLSAGSLLWWANHTGLPDSWRAEIERALTRQGIHAEVGSLRWNPLRGIAATEVTLFADESRARVLAKLHELAFDIDRSRLSAGDLRLDRLDLTGARILLAADPTDPSSPAVEVTDARGRIQIGEGRKIEVHDASGMVGGLRLEVEAEILNHRPGTLPTPEDLERQRDQRRRIITRIAELLDQWAPRGGDPPLVRIDARGDLDDPASYRATVAIRGHAFRSHELSIDSLNLRAGLLGPALVMDELEVRTPAGDLTGGRPAPRSPRRGRIDLRSTLHPAPLLAALDLLGDTEMPRFEGRPELELQGSFSQDDAGWTHRLIGHVALEKPGFRQLEADRLETSFSWDGHRLFLEDLVVAVGDERLDGRVFVTPETVRYQAETTLPVDFWQRAVTFEPLSTILDDFSAGPETEVLVRFEGLATPGSRTDWRFAGTAMASDLSFRGMPARRARVTLDLDHHKLDFRDGEVEFDYRGYALREAHGGPATGKLKVDRIRYDREPSTVTIENLRGEAWPAPVVRTFAPALADSLEIYGFHRTPALRASGVVGVGRGQPSQNLLVSFESGAPADYPFLGATLTLGSPRGDVRVLPDRVRVGDLSFGLFDGLVRGRLEASTRGGTRISGELDWTNLSLPELAGTYDFSSRPKGRITGRMDFRTDSREVTGLDGSGHLALTGGELFEVPMFGPLSPVVSTVLGRRKAGFQEATDAFFSFEAEKGVVRTRDFLTTTSSMVFTGDGVADLDRKTLEMTIRMNARGLLGVITLPLRPFYGLFQFRGSGPIEKPTWENVAFTSPPEDQEKILLQPPKARAVESPPPKAEPVSPEPPPLVPSPGGR